MEQYKFRLKIYLVLLFLIVGIGTIGFMVIEGSSPVDALYYSIVTISTVGYGDIHPVSSIGKFFAVVLIVMGVGTFLGVVANATEIMLSNREHQSRIEKLNIVMGLFFSEIGMHLLKRLSIKDTNIEAVKERLLQVETWSSKEIILVKKKLESYQSDLVPDESDYEYLKELLKENKYLLVQLLENPAVVGNGLFTHILRSAFHLYEELKHRVPLTAMDEEDRTHLNGDMKRVYDSLIIQWIDYMKYLKKSYPYLFSFAIRTNPFVERDITE